MRTTFRCLAILAAILILTVLRGYGVSRFRSAAEAVDVYSLPDFAPNRQRSASSRRPLRVGAFNIAHGRGAGTAKSNWDGGRPEERRRRLDAIVRQIREQDLDLLVLNEVDFDSAWSGHVNQAKLIAREAGFRFVAEQRNVDIALPLVRFRFGNAILSRLELKKATRIDYPAKSNAEALLAGNKNGLVAEVELSANSTHALRVVAVHLEHRSEEVRVESAQVLLDLLERAPTPLLLLGDFNSTPTGCAGSRRSTSGENAVDILFGDGRFGTSAPARRCADPTFPAPNPERTIDWILVSDGWTISTTVPIITDLSDHAMIVAEIEVP